jgi:hypothetical protein
MSFRLRRRMLLPLAAIGLAVALGGCVYTDGYYGYGYYGSPGYAYVPPPAVSFDFGYWGHPGWHHG